MHRRQSNGFKHLSDRNRGKRAASIVDVQRRNLAGFIIVEIQENFRIRGPKDTVDAYCSTEMLELKRQSNSGLIPGLYLVVSPLPNWFDDPDPPGRIPLLEHDRQMRPVLMHHPTPPTTMNAHPSEVLSLANPRLIDVQHIPVEPMVLHSVRPGALQQLSGHLRRLFRMHLALDDGVVNMLTPYNVHKLIELPGADSGPSKRSVRALGAVPGDRAPARAGRLFKLSRGRRGYLSRCLLQRIDGGIR